VVRKACVDNFVEISQMCEPEVRESSLTNTYLKFFKDINKWVKISAYKNLGPFISTLSGRNISDKLLEFYSQMTDNSANNLSNDNEVGGTKNLILELK
jgi:serine/threonine-protein phosphatase 4 regulatory subunit 1